MPSLRNLTVLLCLAAGCGPVPPTDVQRSIIQLGAGPDGAWFKTRPEDPSRLRDGYERCFLPTNSLVALSEPATFGPRGHLRVTLAAPLPDCDFVSGYFLRAELGVEPATGSRAEEPVSRPADSPMAAFLSMIAYAEGTGDRYDLLFGYEQFTSYARHPNRRVCKPSTFSPDGMLCSTAAGRYQIIHDTWVSVVLAAERLPDFSPRSQDRAAKILLWRRGVNNADRQLTYQEFQRAVTKIKAEWASMPGSQYGQPTRTMAELWRVYSAELR